MIRGFADKEPERLFRRERVKSIPAAVRRPALRKLAILNAAESLDDLQVPPANRLEKLRGDRKGRHSIRINEIVRGRRSVSADTALRLARYFGNTERFWLNLQAQYDLEIERDRLGDRLQREVLVRQKS